MKKKEERKYAESREELFREFHRVIAPVVVLKVDGTKKIVFLASPKPQNSEEKNWAWTQVQDDKNLIEYLKVGNKAIMEAESHRGTITKDTFELAGFTKAIERLQKVCK